MRINNQVNRLSLVSAFVAVAAVGFALGKGASVIETANAAVADSANYNFVAIEAFGSLRYYLVDTRNGTVYATHSQRNKWEMKIKPIE